MENKKSQRNIPLSVGLVAAIVLSFLGAAGALGFGFAPYWAIGGFDIVRSKSGHVMARAVILNDNGFPTYVEYDAAGEEVREIAEASGFYADASLMSADRYRQIVENFRALKSEYEDTIALGAYVLTRDAYNATQFKTRNGEAVTRVPKLQESTLSVLVRHADQILIGDISPILFEAPIDLSEVEDVPDNILSLLISSQGRVLGQAEGNIGFRSGYYKGDEDGIYWTKRLQDEDVYNGLANVEIEIPAGSVHGRAVTDESGYYKATYLLVPCPGFYFDYTIPIYAKMRYRMFNPRSASHNIFHMVATHYDACNGYGSSGSYSFFPANFLVDTAMLSGQGYMANPAEGSVNSVGQVVPMTTTGPTAYQYEAPQLERIAQTHFDFDGDEKPDRSVLGNLEDVDITDPATGAVTQEKRFVPADNGELQGVYLSSGSNNPELPVIDDSSQPDFVRLADRKQDFTHQGLVETISEEDYKDTDLYVFRESNGMLVTHRRGLRDNEFAIRSNDGVDGDQIFYQLLIRGPKTRAGTLSNDFSSFQSKADMNPALHAREADHLRPMEPIKIIAINRKTGYIGSVRTAFMDYSQPGLISVDIEKLVMRPPNLKVKAERIYDIEAGMTKGEEQEYLIGYEGAATTNDTIVTITTEWYDHDGTPLPEGLGEYGYTGRLAKVSGANTLSTDGGQLAQFSVKPGRHLQTIRLKGDYDSSEHFYIQINGEPSNENPDFSTLGAAADGPLQYRPKHYVPFLVPLMNEDATIRQYNAYRALRRDDSIPNDQVVDPGPVHEWFYRPEMQFSMYDLQFQHIYRVADEEAGEAIDILPAETPTIASSDDLIRLAYDMVAQQFSALPYLGPGQELVFAFGEEEIGAVLDRNANVVFTNLEHFASLDPEDFLSIRLYNNNDPGNVLWEYAFQSLSVFPPKVSNLEPYKISADYAGDFALSGFFLGNLPDKGSRVTWRSTPAISFDKITENVTTLGFNNSADLPTQAGTEVNIDVENSSGNKVSFHPLEIVAGAPHSINTSIEGKAAIDGFGTITINADVFDQFGNRVEDGTVVTLSAESLIGNTNELTAGGKVSFKVQGTNTPGDQIVEIGAGSVTSQLTIHVHDIDLAISIPEEINVGTEVPVTVTGTSSYGDLSGLAVHLSSVRAALPSDWITLQGNTASFSMYVGEFRGDGAVYVTVGDKITYKDFVVSEVQNAYLLDNVLVEGGSGIGEFSAGGATFQYTDQTSLVINGTPGTSGSITLVDYLEPPMLPELQFSMQRPPKLDGAVIDEVIGLQAASTNLHLVASNQKINKWAYAFSGQGLLEFDYNYLSSVSELGVVLSVQPDLTITSPSVLFEHPASGLRLSLNGSHQLVWQQATTEGVREVVSASLNGSWHNVGAHLIAGELILKVDDTIFRNNEAITGDSLSTSNLIRVGESFVGNLADLRIFDWNAEKIVQFDSGDLEADYQLDGSGRAAVVLRAGGASAFAHISRQRLLHQHDVLGVPILEIAYAQEDSCATPNVGDIGEFDFGDTLSASEALAGHLADCNYLPEIKKAVVTLQSDAGIIRKSVAVTKLAVYTDLYIRMKSAELALAIGPDCAQGIVIGNPDNFVSGTCDFISSLFLVGDLRDFAIHSYWLFTGQVLDSENGLAKYDKATYIFASIGIITTLAEFTGAGIVVDAAVAGCKTVSKLFKGNPYILALAEKASTHILDHWKDSAKLETGFKLMLPTMQITAMVLLLKDEMGKAWDVISGIEAHQLEGWFVYAKEALVLSVPQVVQANPYYGLFHLEVAYAAIDRDTLLRYLDETGAARAFLQALENTFTILAQKGLSSNAIIVKSINEAANLLGKKVDDLKITNADLAQTIAKSDVLSGFVIAFDIGRQLGKTDELMQALTRMRCVPSSCHALQILKDAAGGDSLKAMEAFFGKISDVARLAADGKMTDQAYKGFKDVLEQLGRVSSETGNAIIRVQRGAAHVATELANVSRKIANNTDDFVIEGFEVSVKFGTNGKLGERFYDFTVRANGKLYEVEMKAWDPAKFTEYMRNSLKGLANEGDRLPGQMSKDLTEALKQAGLTLEDNVLKIAEEGKENITKRWAFDSRMTNTTELADELVDILKKDKNLARELLIKSGVNSTDVDELPPNIISNFLNSELKGVLQTIFVI